MGDGLKGLAVVKSEKGEKILSVLERNALRSGVYNGGQMEAIAIPYEECPYLYPDNDVAEKRVVGLLHELLSLFVEHSTERKKLLCLRKNKMCTAILQEAYCDKTAIEAHTLSRDRNNKESLAEEGDYKRSTMHEVILFST
ncbi:hypothetical protein L6452_35097 [Arctium lappa]|uniref:Uncharacterized protein n=1 Tax=Arctium lappa TaxID=4217 RepID=A0ACB8YJC4_ARCLA|nr:hypothetical protein L6452_35097 [Arctium lappa]